MKGKIICVGFQKTGTSTLREALRILGYTVKDTSSRALIPILKGDYAKILKMIKHYDAVEDTPWYIIYQELDSLLPDSKFILTVRDSESWYNSVTRHIGNLRSAHHEWIYGRGKGLPKDDKENTIRVYLNHNKNVIDYFKDRPHDLLTLDFTKGDKWEKLCEFLNQEVPKVPFPHYNKGNRDINKFNLVKKQLKNYIKIRYIDIRNLWLD